MLLILLITISSILSQTVEIERTRTMILDSFMNRSSKDLFKAWHLLFKKEYSYSSDEAKLRFKIFKENFTKIKEHNAQTNQSFKVGLNQFSDMTNNEFKEKVTRYRHNQSIEKYLNTWQENKFLPISDDDDDDLTKRNLASNNAINYQSFFNTPRNQMNCGGCWAFTVTASIESNKSIKQGTLNQYLSVQQLLDCNSQNYGCNGGDLITGMNYVLNTGVENDSDYTYLGYSGNTCKFNSIKTLNKIGGYQYCSNLTTSYKCSTSIVYTLLSKGPLSVVTNGGSWAFQNYAGGIFNSACTTIDHAVTLAGYGISGTTQYWLVRNSWGPNWGESGYIRIEINPSNNYSCFIEYEAILPVV